MSGSVCTSHVASAVDQVSSTFLFAGSCEPEIVIKVPATAWSGVTWRIPMFELGLAAFATGPGSCPTPGMAGAWSAV